VDLAVSKQHRAAGEGRAGETAEHRHLRPRALQRRQQLLRREAEGIAERDHHLVRGRISSARE
jgi:hypothetical protein